jgi:large subunit ribosomal protein L30
MALVKITQERSKIRCMEKHKRTLAALGLRRINHSVIHEDTPQIRGMVHLVRYLVRTEPFEGERAATAPPRRGKRPAGVKKTGGTEKKLGVAKRARGKGTPLSPREATRVRKKRASRS